MTPEPTPDEVRRHAEARFEILAAVRAVHGDAHRLLDLVAETADSAAAVDAVARSYGVSPTGAQAILDMQVRRWTRLDVRRIEEEYAMLRTQLLPE